MEYQNYLQLVEGEKKNYCPPWAGYFWFKKSPSHAGILIKRSFEEEPNFDSIWFDCNSEKIIDCPGNGEWECIPGIPCEYSPVPPHENMPGEWTEGFPAVNGFYWFRICYERQPLRYEYKVLKLTVCQSHQRIFSPDDKTIYRMFGCDDEIELSSIRGEWLVSAKGVR